MSHCGVRHPGQGQLDSQLSVLKAHVRSTRSRSQSPMPASPRSVIVSGVNDEASCRSLLGTCGAIISCVPIHKESGSPGFIVEFESAASVQEALRMNGGPAVISKLLPLPSVSISSEREDGELSEQEVNAHETEMMIRELEFESDRFVQTQRVSPLPPPVESFRIPSGQWPPAPTMIASENVPDFSSGHPEFGQQFNAPTNGFDRTPLMQNLVPPVLAGRHQRRRLPPPVPVFHHSYPSMLQMPPAPRLAAPMPQFAEMPYLMPPMEFVPRNAFVHQYPRAGKRSRKKQSPRRMGMHVNARAPAMPVSEPISPVAPVVSDPSRHEQPSMLSDEAAKPSVAPASSIMQSATEKMIAELKRKALESKAKAKPAVSTSEHSVETETPVPVNASTPPEQPYSNLENPPTVMEKTTAAPAVTDSCSTAEMPSQEPSALPAQHPALPDHVAGSQQVSGPPEQGSSSEAARFLLSVVSRPSKGMPVANQHSVPAPARRVSTTLAGRSKIAREASVARHPSDQFVIHLDGHTSDEDTDGEESGQESQNGSLRTVSELHRIKSTVEALRKRIAKAEAAASSIAISKASAHQASSSSEHPSAVDAQTEIDEARRRVTMKRPSTPTDEPDRGPAAAAPKKPRTGQSESKRTASSELRVKALRSRVSAISKLKSQVGLLNKRRTMLRTRLSIVQAQCARLTTMIDRSSSEIEQASEELARQTAEVDMLRRVIEIDNQNGKSSPDEVAPEPDSTLVANATNETVDVALAANSLRNQLLQFVSSAAVNSDAFPESAPGSGATITVPALSQTIPLRTISFRYESPVQRPRLEGYSSQSVLCPFELLGHCNDDKCTFVHEKQLQDPDSFEALSTSPANSAPVSRRIPARTVAPPASISSHVIDEDSSSEFISLQGSVPTAPDDPSCVSSAISILQDALKLQCEGNDDEDNSGCARYFDPTSAGPSLNVTWEDRIRVQPSNASLWMQWALSCFIDIEDNGDSGEQRNPLLSALHVMSRAVERNPYDLDLWHVYLDLFQLRPDPNTLQLLCTAVHYNPGSVQLWQRCLDASPSTYSDFVQLSLRAVVALMSANVSPVVILRRLLLAHIGSGHVDEAAALVRNLIQDKTVQNVAVNNSCLTPSDRLLLAIIVMASSSGDQDVLLSSIDGYIASRLRCRYVVIPERLLTFQVTHQSVLDALDYVSDDLESINVIVRIAIVSESLSFDDISYDVLSRLKMLPAFYDWAIPVNPALSSVSLELFPDDESLWFVAAESAHSLEESFSSLCLSIARSSVASSSEVSAALDAKLTETSNPFLWMCWAAFHLLTRVLEEQSDSSATEDVLSKSLSGMEDVSLRQRLALFALRATRWSDMFSDLSLLLPNSPVWPESKCAAGNLVENGCLSRLLDGMLSVAPRRRHLDILSQCTAAYPHSIDVLLRIAMHHQSEGNFYACCYRLREVVAIDPSCVAFASMLGQCEVCRGRIFAARAVLKACVDANPLSISAHRKVVVNPVSSELF
ncbi:hypothetical protein PBRA_005195 [Plasmodiophora brassicae]|uniref:C3H1-type domain-containing protein n=1 Tax=Plasmodiophora brassicae TaxID=37360 RepID=A0A0G4IMW2_PLABS|nr:hypothetical protein PBRA_005195 [Plasmodiophora brassicae]